MIPTQYCLMKSLLCALFAVGLLASSSAWPQVATVSLNMHWNEGAKDCKASPQVPIEVHAYNAQAFILRENLCATFEAPFMYLLIGSTKALLIDTGDVGDPKQMPLAETVMHLLPGLGPSKPSVLVVHTHRLAIIAQAMASLRTCLMFRWLGGTLIAFGGITTSPIGRTVLLKSISAIGLST